MPTQPASHGAASVLARHVHERSAIVSTASEFVGSHRDEIFERWFEEASRAASARGLDRPAFANIMPSYLEALATTDDLGAFTGARRKRVESHLASRIRQGFSVEEIVEEFAILARVVTVVVNARRPADRPPPSELERLWGELNRASAAVTDMFVRHMVEDEQTEKRYLRRLQSLATAALQQDAPSQREWLREALETILSAMDARSAALLLYKPETNQLASVASAGFDGIEAYVASLDPSSFVGRAAASEETTEIEDVPTTRLTLPESLRQSGIHSLLGVRLPNQRRLVGVLYVGVAEARPFTARESRRLEALGEQLTLQLDNAALFAELGEAVGSLRSEQEALRAERELRERFVSILAHDLRGPLSAAKVAAQLLIARSERVDDGGVRLATKIVRNIDRTDRMVRDLLDANRLQAGERLPLNLAECDLGAIARDVAEELSALHGRRFVLETEEAVQGVWSTDELKRAVWNLATNAVKYGAPDSPITIRVGRTADGAQLAVHNEGAPIPAEEQRDLFRPFSRSRAAKAGRTTGWGLGLTLVQGSVEAHGGSVAVQSRAGAGTTFTIELPPDARPFQAQQPSSQRGAQPIAAH